MKLIVCKNYEELSAAAAKMAAEQILSNPCSVLGLPTGDTPKGMYKKLREEKPDFSNIRTFNLDEYYPIKKDNPQSYDYFMKNNLFDYINIKSENINIPNGEAEDPLSECCDYEKKIAAAGGIDIMFLGIGNNGHIGFNEPERELFAGTHLTSLTKNTVEANARFFESADDVPKNALTMGMATILDSKKIVILASGTAKRKAVETLLRGKISTDCPASFLNLHKDVTLICDKAAYGGNLKLGVDIGGTGIKFGVAENGKLISKSIIKTNRASAETVIDEIAEECKKILENNACEYIGVGIAGGIEDGLVTCDNLPFKSFPLKKMLEEKLGLPVIVENDANCAGLAEINYGYGKTYKNMVIVTIGTGIGGCIVIDGKIYSGNGCAGEIGHMIVQSENGKKCSCGMEGCFERYASASTLSELALEYAADDSDDILGKLYAENNFEMNGKIIFEALKNGSPLAKKVIGKYTDYLAKGLDGIISIFDPDAVVLAGGITESGDLFIDELRKKISFNTPIVISKQKSDAGILGAICL